MKIGLVLGKFAPLHKGHQMVIERSIEENDQTIVIIYDCPEVTDVPLCKRAKWISQLYWHANVKVIEAWGGDNTVSRKPEVKRKHEEYILNLLGDTKIDNFYSSEFYGAHVSKALGAKDRRVDMKRSAFPISGTDLRGNLFRYKQYLDPVVYSSLLRKVLFLGAPSTGKTTLCKALAKHFGTVWVPEYGRQYWARFNKNRRLTLDQLDTIANTHSVNIYKKMTEAKGYLFVDTDASTTRLFAKYYHGVSTQNLDFKAVVSKEFFDKVFVCASDIPYDDTADRSGSASRDLFQRQIIEDLNDRRVPFTMLYGRVSERIEQVTEAFSRYCYE